MATSIITPVPPDAGKRETQVASAVLRRVQIRRADLWLISTTTWRRFAMLSSFLLSSRSHGVARHPLRIADDSPNTVRPRAGQFGEPSDSV
jgi:hypothetical protein